jgi:hypothetical protein
MVYGCEKSKFKKLDNKIELLFLVQKKKKKTVNRILGNDKRLRADFSR